MNQVPRARADSRYYTTAQVAAIFNVDAKTVTRWGKDGKLTFIWTPGGSRRYLRSGVDAYLTAQS